MVRPCVARGLVDLSVCGLASMYPASDWSVCAPGHHGHQRAYVLISGQTSSGPFGSPGFACAVKTDPPSRLEPLADLGGKRESDATSSLPSFIGAVPLFVPLGSFLRPGPQSCRAPRAGAVKTGRPRRPPTGLGLDGSEHGVTVMQVGTKRRASSRIRMRALG